MENKYPKFCDGCKEESCRYCDKLPIYLEGLNEGKNEVLSLITRYYESSIRKLLGVEE